MHTHTRARARAHGRVRARRLAAAHHRRALHERAAGPRMRSRSEWPPADSARPLRLCCRVTGRCRHQQHRTSATRAHQPTPSSSHTHTTQTSSHTHARTHVRTHTHAHTLTHTTHTDTHTHTRTLAPSSSSSSREPSMLRVAEHGHLQECRLNCINGELHS
jgi:hypothetical protein